jgi:hypothetical protein
MTFFRLFQLVTALNVAVASWERHLSQVQEGLEPIVNELKFDKNFVKNDEYTDIKLSYQGQHHPDLLNLFTHEQVAHVEYTSESLITITLGDTIDDFDQNWLTRVGHPLTAVETNTGNIVYRKVEAVKQCGDKCLQFQCTKLELHDMFASLKLKMSYTPSDENTSKQKSHKRRLLSERMTSDRSNIRGLVSATDLSTYVTGLKSIEKACTLKRRRLGFMKDAFSKWKSESKQFLSSAKSTWDDETSDVRSEFQSESNKNKLECAVGPNIEINYDSEKSTYKKEILNFSPWAKCHGCYLWAGVKVVVEIDVSSTGLNKFVAYVEGGLKANAKVIAKNPTITSKGDFNVIIPPESLGTLTFAVGSVPVKIKLKSGLEMSGTSDGNVNASFTSGVAVRALWREG